MSRSIFCIRQTKYQQFWHSHFKSIKKRQGFSLFLNKSIGVMEHFLRTSNEISTILKFTFQKYQKNDKDCHYFWIIPSVWRSKILIKPSENQCFWIIPSVWRSISVTRHPGRTPPRSSPRHPSKNVTISFIKLSQIHHFLLRSSLAPFWHIPKQISKSIQRFQNVSYWSGFLLG